MQSYSIKVKYIIKTVYSIELPLFTFFASNKLTYCKKQEIETEK